MADSLPAAALELDREATAKLAGEVAAMLSEHREGIAGRPVGRSATPAEFERALGGIDESGCAPAEVLGEIAGMVLPNIVQQDHPRYFASIPSPGNGVAAFAEAIAAGANIFAGNWAEGSGAEAIELACLDWLRDLCGLPAEAGGLFTSGGTMATLIALAAARDLSVGEPGARGILYTSVEGHLSVERAAKVLGLDADQIRKLPVDGHQRLDPAVLSRTIAADRAAGLRPFAVVATAGSTSTAVVDPLEELGELCGAERLWLHVDAAYGGPALLTPSGRALLAGIERADSITLDPHKWLFQPFGLGCLLARDPSALRRAFRLVPAYLEELSGAGDIDFYDYGIEVSRPFRALRLWLSLRVFGVAAFRDAIAHGLHLAEVAAEAIVEDPRLELVTGPQLGVVCFSYADAELDAETRGWICDQATRELAESNWAVAGCTQVAGKRVMRMCTMNPRTSPADARRTVELLADAAERAALSAPAPSG